MTWSTFPKVYAHMYVRIYILSKLLMYYICWSIIKYLCTCKVVKFQIHEIWLCHLYHNTFSNAYSNTLSKPITFTLIILKRLWSVQDYT